MSESREKEKKMGRREWYRSLVKREKEVSGCMSGMFQFLDFHNILFTPSSNSGRAAQSPSPQIHHCSSNSQFNGVEAPRNSLELDEASAAAKTSAAFAIAAEEDYYGIPIGIQVNSAPLLSLKKTKNKKNQGLEEDEKRGSQSQCITPRTTNLVARLMGLDISSSEGPSTPKSSFKSLNSSPKISTKNRQPLKKKDTNVRLEVGTRSLPDTPRASSERSRDADPRLSLQINKENVSRAGHLCEYSSSLPPSPTKGYSKKSRKKESCLKENDENRSPRSHYYAREIVKHVKEDTHRGEKEKFSADDDKKQFLKSPKPQALPKHPQPKSATSVLRVRDQNAEITKPTKTVASSCNKASTEKFTDRIKKKPPLSEAATRSDPTLSRRLTSPLPSQSSSPNLVASSSQKHGSSSRENMKRCSSAATLASREYYLPASAFSAEEHQGFKYARAPKDQDPEFLYVRSILQRSGITNPTQPRRYSPSLAVDPFVFHQLELDLPVLFPYLINHRNPIRHRSNRKLLFHLVQEALADLLARPRLDKANLLDRVWTQIRSFPLADCQAMEDVEALVAGDLAEARVRRLLSHPLVAAEAERIALEVEEDVMDSVVGEAAASLALCSRP